MIAGDTLKVELAQLAIDYPASDSNSVSAIFTPIAGGTPAEIAASDGSDSWLITVPAATSVGWAAGRYRWTVRVTKGTDKLTVDQGEILVEADPASAATDTRSHARKTLDALEAVIENRASATDKETTFADGRSITKLSHGELLDMKDRYAKLVGAEERRLRGAGPGRVLVRL